MDEKNKKIEMDYIRSQREKGVNDEAIKKALREAGWSEEDISVGFSELDGQQDVPQKQTEEERKEEPVKAEEDNSFGATLNDVPEEREQQAEKQKSEEGTPEISPKESLSDNNAMPSGFTKSETSGSTEGGVKSENVAGSKEATESNTPAEEGAVESETEQAKPSVTPASETPSAGVSDNVAEAKTGQEEEAKEDPMADLPEQGSENMLKIALLVIVALLILGGAGVAAYFIVQGMVGNMDNMTKEEIINESVLSYVKADSFSNVTEVGLSLDEFAEADLLVDGSYKKAESLEDHLTDLEFEGDFVFSDGGMTMEFGAKGEFRIVDGESYVYLEEATEIPFVGDLSSLEEQWLSMGVKEGLDESGASFTSDDVSQVDEDVIKAIENSGVRFLELGQEKDAFIITELSDKDGLKRYSIEIDMENLPELMRILPDEFRSLKSHKQDIMESADEAEEDLEEMKEENPDLDPVLPVEVHINKEDLQLRQVSLEWSQELSVGNLDVKIDGEELEELTLDLSIVSSFSDIGKEFDVEKPDADESLKEAVKELLDQTFEGASLDEGVEPPEVDTIRTSLENVQLTSRSYEGSYSGICEKEDMKEAVKEAVDLAGADGEVSDYCNDGEKYWVVAVPEKDESVSCTDSQGSMIEVDQNFERPLSSDVESCSDSFSLDDEEQQLEISSGLTDLLRAGAGWIWK
ncbi:MAG: hypothetical protein ACLFNR_00820 [Candidatus Paceibacterota bacterium]